MSSSTTFFLDDPPQSGVRNMAVDEALLELGQPVLRFYRWNEPTVSLGYFQRYDDRNGHESSRHCPLVRRRSGGGAIIHDRELTYSLVLPHDFPLAVKRLELYEAIHRSFIAVLKHFGVAAEFSGIERGGTNVFLCFQRLSPGDVVIRDGPRVLKILGSAQYRNKAGSILQHGSLLLDRSDAASELDGIRQISDLFPSVSELIEALKFRLSGDFFWNFQTFAPETIERTVAFFEETRYTEGGWTRRK